MSTTDSHNLLQINFHMGIYDNKDFTLLFILVFFIVHLDCIYYHPGASCALVKTFETQSGLEDRTRTERLTDHILALKLLGFDQ